MNLYEIFSLIFIHWFADFVMQDEKWALGKSKNNKDLLSHTLVYTSVWLYIGMILYTLPLSKVVIFSVITFVFHTVTDYFTSRIVSKKFAEKHYGSDIPNFGAFTIIGIDQVLHYIQLFLTYNLLK